MGEALKINLLSFEEYEALERETGMRYEFHFGEVFDMAGGSNVHSAITVNMLVALANKIKQPCKVYNSDIRLEITPNGRYVYPDAMITCHPEDVKGRTQIIRYPSVVAEVLSESTKGYDSAEKRHYYFSLPSVRYYILVHQDQCCVEMYEREETCWKLKIHTQRNEQVHLSDLEISVLLEDIYKDIDFEEIGRA